MDPVAPVAPCGPVGPPEGPVGPVAPVAPKPVPSGSQLLAKVFTSNLSNSVLNRKYPAGAATGLVDVELASNVIVLKLPLIVLFLKTVG